MITWLMDRIVPFQRRYDLLTSTSYYVNQLSNAARDANVDAGSIEYSNESWHSPINGEKSYTVQITARISDPLKRAAFWRILKPKMRGV